MNEKQPVGRWSRRRFLKATGASAVVAAAAAADARFVEPGLLTVNRTDVPRRLFAMPEGTRILHLTDLHLGPDVPEKLISEAVALGLAERPDIVALTGDFVTGRLGDPARYASLLRPLAVCAPSFACPGNHDGIPGADGRFAETDCRHVGRMLESAGIRFLFNTTATLRIRDKALRIAGLGDRWAGDARPRACLTSKDAPDDGTPVLLLNHNPDARSDLMPYRWHLMLSGHTHGGQTGLPLLGRLLAPVEDKSHIEGLRERDGRLIHISRGVGNFLGVRFLCPPQVSVLTVV